MTTAIVSPLTSKPAQTKLIDLAAEAGFKGAAQNATHQLDVARRAALAYEHFRYVTAEQIQNFQDRLHKSTMKASTFDYSYDRLRFRTRDQYPNLPPQDVLEAVAKAASMKIFDSFEVADIETVRVVKDPIVFGCITGISDKFYIAQWGDDVKISDLLADHEG